MSDETDMIGRDMSDAQRRVNDALTDVEDIGGDSTNWDAPEIEQAADTAREALEELGRLIGEAWHRLPAGGQGDWTKHESR